MERSLWRLGGLGLKELAKRVYQQFWEDRVLGQAAQLSFYFLLALFPLLLFLTSLLGLVLQSDTALYDLLNNYLSTVLPESVSRLVQSILQEVTQRSDGGKLSFGLLFSLWAASSGMVAVIDALNIAYEVKEFRPWWKRRLVAIGLTVGFVALIISALLLMIYGGRLIQWALGESAVGTMAAQAWRLGEWVLLIGLVLTAFNILYIIGPNVKRRRWHWLMPGTVAGAALWVAASFGFKLYLNFGDRYSVTYGSIGTVIVLLLWLYLTGVALLLGGEVNSEIEAASGTTTHADAS